MIIPEKTYIISSIDGEVHCSGAQLLADGVGTDWSDTGIMPITTDDHAEVVAHGDPQTGNILEGRAERIPVSPCSRQDDPIPLPGWVVEFPHRGDPRAYRIKNLAELEAAAEAALGDNTGPLWEVVTFAEALEECCGSLEEMRLEGPAWAKLADEGRGVVLEVLDASGADAEWLEAEPVRSARDRCDHALFALGHDLSHLEMVPEAELAGRLADAEAWNRPWGRCGGPAGRHALLCASGS